MHASAPQTADRPEPQLPAAADCVPNSARTGEWVIIQRNPRSGAGAARRALRHLVRGLHVAGYRVQMFRDRDRMRRWLERCEDRTQIRCLVAAGGDGTVADVINRFPGWPVAILPAGTENLLARHFQIPKDGRAVARLIVNGRRKVLDVCSLEGRRFVLMASAGVDARIVHEVHARRSGHITRFSYVKPIWNSLQNYPYPQLRVWLDDASEPLEARELLVSNLPAYALGLKFAADADGSDGLLNVRLLRYGSAFQMVRYLYNVIVGKLENLPDVVSTTARRIRIEADAPVPVQIDGDPAGETPAEIRILPAALTLFIP